jgi:hypothetical protein
MAKPKCRSAREPSTDTSGDAKPSIKTTELQFRFVISRSVRAGNRTRDGAYYSYEKHARTLRRDLWSSGSLRVLVGFGVFTIAVSPGFFLILLGSGMLAAGGTSAFLIISHEPTR